MTIARSINYRLSANVSGWVKGLDKAADKTAESRREVSALEKRLDQLGRKTTEPKVNLDSDEARDRLTQVQSRLTKLGSTVAEAKARVDDADSQAKLSRIEAQLLRVGSATAKPDIDLAGVAAAESDLATLTSQLQRFDGSDYRAQVHVGGTLQSSRRMQNLIAAGAALGPALVPAAAAASGAMLGLGSAAGVAAAGAGASSLAFMGVGDALSAMAEAETAAASNAADMARKQVTASRQIQDAKLRLAAAERDRTQTARQGAQAIADAQREVVAARRDAAEAAEDAADQVADAQRNLRDAHERVRIALDELHTARRQAIRDMQDLREQTRDNALSEEAAEIRLIEARRELRELTRDGTASSLDLRKARLDVAQAEDRLSDVHREARRDQAELNEAEREGIAGADAVVDARRNVRQAEEGVADAKRALAGAVEAQAEQQRESARSIAEAERNLARTRQQVAAQNQDAARQVAAAQRGVQRALADMNRTMSQSSSEAGKLAEKMSALSPAGRDFVRFLFSLRPKLEELQRIAQEGMFPGVEAGIRDLLTLFPILERLVDGSSRSLGNLAEEAGEALTSPFWRDFFNWVADEAGPTLDKFGRIAGNTATGFAGLAMASDELADGFTDDLLRMSQRFAEWGKQLEESDEFRRFVEYVQRVSPKVWKTVGAIADALLALAEAAAPVGEFTLPIIRGLARAFAAVMRSPAGPVIVGAAAALATMNRAVRGYDVARNSRIVQLLGDMGGTARRARGRLGRLGQFLGRGGPWGVALTLAAGGLLFFWQQQQKAEQHVEDLTASLNDQTGALTRNTKQMVIRKLEESGALRTARKFGISIGLVTKAALGNTEAQQQLNREISAFSHGSLTASGTTQVLDNDLSHLRSTVLGESSAVADSRRKHDRMRTALEAVTRSSKGAEQQGRQHEKQLRRVADKLNLTEKQTRQLIDEYGNVPNRVTTKVRSPGLDHTTKGVKGLYRELKGLEGEYNVYVGNGITIGRRAAKGPSAIASGGLITGPGSGTSDSILARGPGRMLAVSNGEFIQRASAVNREGPDKMNALNEGRATITPFAKGGEVTPDINARFRMRWVDKLNRLVDGLRPFGGGKGLSFARRQDGEPYVWGGVGPYGWDCSGLWSGVVNAIHGRDPNQRLFSTHSFAGGDGVSGFVRGLRSPVMIGVDPGSHMAGTIHGVNVESSGSQGVRVGPAARGAGHSMFDYQFGLAGVGPVRKARDRGLANEGILADRGAMLPQGVSLVRNATGGSEHAAVFTDSQWASLRSIAAAPGSAARGGGASAGNTYVLNQSVSQPGASPSEVADETMFAFRAQLRGA